MEQEPNPIGDNFNSLEVVDESNFDYNSLNSIDECNLCSNDEFSEDYIIYVGTNTENGNGSFENPFASFDLACDDISVGKGNVTINVLDGTYIVGSDIVFNCSNLHINGSDNVIITYNNTDGKQSFDLISNQSTFTVSNIIIDYSNWNLASTELNQKYFHICRGTPENIIFNNCTFLEYYDCISQIDYTYRHYFFNNCTFISTRAGNRINGLVNYVSFKNCIFSWEGVYSSLSNQATSSTLTPVFDDCWFGVNKIPDQFYTKRGSQMRYHNYIVNRYAIFSISENYLGNNIYEIIGKLAWNDGTTDGIENLNPMTVTLNVDYGGYLNQTTAILENGTFKVQYTSTSSNNKITATLDQQPVSVEFKSINISADSPTITYGDKQNITVTLPDSYNGFITVTVNNKNYTQEVEYTNVVTINITDVLSVGTWDVNVTFIDETPSAHTYGFNTTKITVNKAKPNVGISYDGILVPGEKLLIKVEIPNATENVTIIVNGDENTREFVSNVATYTIEELTAGTYYVTVVYKGDDNFNFAYKTDSFDVVKSTQELIKDLNDTVNAQADTIANQTQQISDLNSTVNAQADTIANQTQQISSLNDTVNAQSRTIDSQKAIINNLKNGESKKATKLTAPKKTFKAKTKTKKIKIKLTTGKTALKNKKITLKVKGKTYTAKTNKKGIATFKITKLTKKGTFKYTVKFAGDKAYKATSKNGKIKIK